MGAVYFALAQPGGVLGDGAHFAFRHAGGNAAHHAVGIVGALAALEGSKLRGDVLGELSCHARVLRRHPGPGRTVATRAGRHAGAGDAAAPDLLPERCQFLVGGSRRRGAPRPPPFGAAPARSCLARSAALNMDFAAACLPSSV